MNSCSNTILVQKIYLIDSDFQQDPDFSKELSARTGAIVETFTSIDDVLSAKNPHLFLVNFKTMEDEQVIQDLNACFAVPMIVLSQRPSLAQAVKAMRMGACDFFPKPVSLDAISDRINGILEQISLSALPNPIHERGRSGVAPFWEQEREIIETALNACNGNISKAAAALQISPSTIYRKRQSWQ